MLKVTTFYVATFVAILSASQLSATNELSQEEQSSPSKTQTTEVVAQVSDTVKTQGSKPQSPSSPKSYPKRKENLQSSTPSFNSQRGKIQQPRLRGKNHQ